MELQGLKVAVIGGGYAGASTAKALSALDADVTVYEQASQSGEVGAGIGLRPSSMAAFRQWGIFEDIARVSTPSEGLQILSPTGAFVQRDPWPEKDIFDTTTHFIHRRDFIDVLLSVLPIGMVEFGKRLTTIVDDGTEVRLGFADGSHVTADLVIGADGINSIVRRTLFDDKPPSRENVSARSSRTSGTRSAPGRTA
jgi:salicylate hydroxylase